MEKIPVLFIDSITNVRDDVDLFQFLWKNHWPENCLVKLIDEHSRVEMAQIMYYIDIKIVGTWVDSNHYLSEEGPYLFVTLSHLRYWDPPKKL